jgi:hypothetical protein
MSKEMTANHYVEKFMRVHTLDEPSNLYRQSVSDEDLPLSPALDWPINRKVQQAFEFSAFQHRAQYELSPVSRTVSRMPPNKECTALSSPFSTDC